MLQLSFKLKEVAQRVNNIGQLQSIALALKAGNASGEMSSEQAAILLHIQFDSPDDVLLFCKTVGVMKVVRDIETLEKEKKDIESEIDELKQKKRKLLQ